jgi:hypothetical protein
LADYSGQSEDLDELLGALTCVFHSFLSDGKIENVKNML